MEPDCLDKGQHIGNMGYRYNATYNVEICGTITMVNSLAAIKKLVYDDKKHTLEKLKVGMFNNFGYKNALEAGNYSMATQIKEDGNTEWDKIHRDCLNAPKYGNDDFYVDSILKDYEQWLCDMTREVESLYGKIEI